MCIFMCMLYFSCLTVVGRPKFKLETNSTVVWLYAGGISLILHDVMIGLHMYFLAIRLILSDI